MRFNHENTSILRLSYIVLFVFFSCRAYSQDANIHISHLNKPIQLDGSIDESWMECDSVVLNFQLEPDYGALPSKKTIVKVSQFNETIYFLFVCNIAGSEEVTARIQQRDKLNNNDDLISVLLDTYDDNRTAILFQVNPLGTLGDAKVTNDGKSIDYLWDTEWEASAAVNSAYWVVEMGIPLSSIQFNPGTEQWGCNFSRSVRVNQEIDWWQSTTENHRVSQSGQLSGLQLTSAGKHRLTLFPYGTVRYEDSDLTGNHNTVKGDAGMDIRYNYSSNINANIAINPDFATVEGDKEQINLTPFELKFPEKRLFFQDGNELFDTRIQTFYSRRIGDILLGGKVNGKIGKYQFNGLYANTKEDPDQDIASGHYNAFRLKRDFLEASALGLTYTNKITDTLTYHTFSADYILNLANNWKLTGQLVSSMPGDFASHSAWFVRFAKENNTYHYHIRYTEIGENFQDIVNETGFIKDDDRRELDSDVNYKFWFDNVANYLKLSGKNNLYWSQSGTLRSWYLTYGGRCYFRNKISVDFYYNTEYKNSFRDISDNYYNHFVRGIIGYNTDENSYAEISYHRGVNFKRDFDFLEFNSSIQLFKKVSVNYELKYLTFHPDSENESTWLNILGISYYQTKDLWLRVFTQHNSADNRIYFYCQAGWRFKPPFGALYIIYSTDNYQDLLEQEHIKSNILFLKLTYPFDLLR